jgi:hypothetical protein
MADQLQAARRVLSSDRSGTTDRPRFIWLVPIAAAALVVVWFIATYWTALNRDKDNIVPIGFGILLSVVLAALPPVICLVQNVSRRRQLGKLASLEGSPVAQTVLYKAATRSIGSIRLVVDVDYGLPIFVFFLITFFGFLAVLVGYSAPQFFTNPSVLLGAFQDQSDKAAFAAYQLQTFSVVALAFIGSYIYALSRIVERINNNDLYPISLYIYVVRIVTACSVAAVLRHTMRVFGDAAATVLPGMSAGAGPLLLLIGFAIGFAPDLFIVSITRKAFQTLKIWGTRDDPGDAARPLGLPLLMIDDLTREKIDRLNELDIDNAQALARQNPFLLLPRLPFDLGLLLDWIGQAQLYVLVKEERLKELRNACIRDILDFHVRLADDAARADVCQTLKLSAAAGKALLQQLDDDQSFLRLRQVRDAMKPAVQPAPSA